MQCLTLMRSLGVTPANIATNNILLKTRFTGLHFRCRKYWCTFNHFYVIRPKIYRTEFGEITLRLGPLCHSRSSKVTEFGTNRKLTCNFLLVIKGWGGDRGTDLSPILHRFRDMAFNRSKIQSPKSLYLATRLVFNTPDGGVPLG